MVTQIFDVTNLKKSSVVRVCGWRVCHSCVSSCVSSCVWFGSCVVSVWCLCDARNCTWPLWKIMVSYCGFRGTSQCSVFQIVHEAKLHLKLGVLHALSSINEDSPFTPVEKVVLCNVGLTDFFSVKRRTNKCKNCHVTPPPRETQNLAAPARNLKISFSFTPTREPLEPTP